MSAYKIKLPKNIKPFLKLPFEEQPYELTEGWHYSDHEKSIHHMERHGGIDFALPRGTKVIAPLPGWAIASYWNRPILDETGKPIIYKRKEISVGTGWFVQIYHPEQKLFTLYAHLELIDPAIKAHQPIKRVFNKGGVSRFAYWPVGHKVLPGSLPKYPYATWVKEGQVIGLVGDSGIGWGYSDYPTRPDPKKFPPWDEVHLHFEVFVRYGVRRFKRGFDPYGLKDTAQVYPDSSRKGSPLGTKTSLLWKLDSTGKPEFVSLDLK